MQPKNKKKQSSTKNMLFVFQRLEFLINVSFDSCRMQPAHHWHGYGSVHYDGAFSPVSPNSRKRIMHSVNSRRKRQKKHDKKCKLTLICSVRQTNQSSKLKKRKLRLQTAVNTCTIKQKCKDFFNISLT